MLDPKYLSTDHLTVLKAGTKLVLRTHLNNIEEVVYRGYVANNGWMPNSDTVIIHLLHERHSHASLKSVCFSKYADEEGYFTFVGHGTRFEILEVIEPEVEVPLLVMSKFQTGIPWIGNRMLQSDYPLREVTFVA